MNAFTQVDLDRVRAAAHELAMQAPKLVEGHPLFAVAALSMAACHAALMTDTSFETLVDLLKLQYTTAAAALAARDVEDTGGAVVIPPLPEGQSS